MRYTSYYRNQTGEGDKKNYNMHIEDNPKKRFKNKNESAGYVF